MLLCRNSLPSFKVALTLYIEIYKFLLYQNTRYLRSLINIYDLILGANNMQVPHMIWFIINTHIFMKRIVNGRVLPFQMSWHVEFVNVSSIFNTYMKQRMCTDIKTICYSDAIFILDRITKNKQMTCQLSVILI